MNKVQAKLIEVIEENEDQLTDWERKFIDDITSNDYTLTDKQNSIVNRIHHRVVFE
ncbi:MAG: hypothetical protein GY815_05665 [Gammaproteobacteria bacterium]|nr:hypothetical protein [Gammaproteobacteria bacterium]